MRQMSRTMIGIVTGVAVVAVAAIPSLASTERTMPTQTPAVASTSTATAGQGSAAAAKPVMAMAVKTTKAVTTTKRVTVTPAAAKTVRSVKLVMPTTTNKVGANVSGYIQVQDTADKVAAPVLGVEVALQQLRGRTYVEIATGVTDQNGMYAVAFTSATNMSLRAVLKPATGKPLYGAVVMTSAVAQVTWAARPAMEALKKTKVTYSFRVNPESGTGQMQIANAKTPTKWLKTTAVKVPLTGVVTPYVVFPSAGTWLVRGATIASVSNGAGYTTTVKVTVR